MSGKKPDQFGRIIVVGLQAVGKSSIINRIQEKDFNPAITPTLGVQVYKLAIENTNFQILDLGGQDKLRHLWFNKNHNPDGIIYVVDCTASKEKHQKDREELNRIVEFFFKGIPKEKQPILMILGNKIDIAGENYPYLLQDTFFDLDPKLGYKMGYCSAKTQEGIMDNLKWLIAEIIKRTPL
jgi:small GTP-binding protein